ncbi:hypothetical protein LINPERPRIM_LOCUS32274 [Linum perenne]
MEKSQIISKDKLEFLDIIKASWNITSQNPHFILLSFLISLPAFLFSLWQQLLLQQLFFVAANFSIESVLTFRFNPWYALHCTIAFIQHFYPTIILLSFSYLTIGHLLSLINTIVVVHSASTIYAGKKETQNLKEMLFSPFRQVGLLGPYITSVCNSALGFLVLVGLASLGVQMFESPLNVWVSKVVFGPIFVALLGKYVEWSAIWNTGLVLSILEGKHGYIGIGVSGYISRGSRMRGFLLMLALLVCRVVLTLRVGFFWYYGFFLNMESSGYVVLFCATAAGEGGLVWFGEVMNWVICTVYYYDCRRRFLEKKVDLERQR